MILNIHPPLSSLPFLSFTASTAPSLKSSRDSIRVVPRSNPEMPPLRHPGRSTSALCAERRSHHLVAYQLTIKRPTTTGPAVSTVKESWNPKINFTRMFKRSRVRLLAISPPPLGKHVYGPGIDVKSCQGFGMCSPFAKPGSDQCFSGEVFVSNQALKQSIPTTPFNIIQIS